MTFLFALATAHAGPLAIPHRAPQPPPRAARPAPAVKAPPPSTVMVRNATRRAMLVETQGQQVWLDPWERASLQVRPGQVDIEASVMRHGRLVEIQDRTVWLEPRETEFVDLERPRRFSVEVVQVPSVSVSWHRWHGWGHRHHGHHHRH